MREFPLNGWKRGRLDTTTGNANDMRDSRTVILHDESLIAPDIIIIFIFFIFLGPLAQIRRRGNYYYYYYYYYYYFFTLGSMILRDFKN